MHILDWEEYTNSSEQGTFPDNGNCSLNLAITVGVFDGIHRGHQSLIQRVCAQPPLHCSLLPTVVTFRQNPQQILAPDTFAGDIISLEQKLHVLEFFGVELTVLIDFSMEFSKINGRDFIALLLGCRPVKLLALGRNFRCGHGLDTGAEEIRSLAEERGVEAWVAPPVMDEGQPISSSRIRQALAAGRQVEAARLMGWPSPLQNR